MNSHFKVISIMITVLGIVGQISQALGGVALPGSWNVIVIGIGAVATDILHILQQIQTQPPPVVPPAVPSKPSALFWGILLASLLGATSVNAGYLISNPKAEKTSLTLPSGTDLYAMSIEGFQVGASLPQPTYGFSFNEDLVLGQTSTVNGGTNLSPILGAGLSIYADGAGVINGNGPLVLLGGFNVIGPDLDLFGIGNGEGLVPDVLFTKNFGTGESKITGGLTVFTDLGPGTAVKIAGK